MQNKLCKDGKRLGHVHGMQGVMSILNFISTNAHSLITRIKTH